MSTQLIVMRITDMRFWRRDQDNSRVCDVCGHQVGIYPSGQAVLKKHPNTEIVCNVCIGDKPGGIPAPGALDEARQQHRKRT